MDKLLEIKNVCKVFGKNESEIKALSNINISIRKGELIGIVGPSGSGKTTLLNIMGCLDLPTNGEYFLNGSNILKLNDRKLAKIRNTEIGFVIQDYALIEYETVYNNVVIPLKYARKRNKREIVCNILRQLGIEDKEMQLVRNLSGGQKQRVAIARALVNNPSIILADEPTGALDTETGKQIFELLKSINKNGKTVIIVTHDINLAEKCDRTISIVDGKIKL